MRAAPTSCHLHPDEPRPDVCWTCERVADVAEVTEGRDLDERPRCEDCTRRLGRAEADAGVCLGCQRVRIATEIARAGVRR